MKHLYQTCGMPAAVI